MENTTPELFHIQMAPELFREMSVGIRSDWLYQKYAVMLRPMNLEHCIQPTKGVCLDAVRATPAAAEFLPFPLNPFSDLALQMDIDIRNAILAHAETKDATRYITYVGEFNEKWYANDKACLSNDITDIKALFHSRIPSSRSILLQDMMKEQYEYPRMSEDASLYMPHVFYGPTHDSGTGSVRK